MKSILARLRRRMHLRRLQRLADLKIQVVDKLYLFGYPHIAEKVLREREELLAEIEDLNP